MTWTIDRVPGFKAPFFAHDPACPPGPHPTRDCRCRNFRTEQQAVDYIKEVNDGTPALSHGTPALSR